MTTGGDGRGRGSHPILQHSHRNLLTTMTDAIVTMLLVASMAAPTIAGSGGGGRPGSISIGTPTPAMFAFHAKHYDSERRRVTTTRCASRSREKMMMTTRTSAHCVSVSLSSLFATRNAMDEGTNQHRNNNQRPPRWQPQRTSLPPPNSRPSTSTSYQYSSSGADRFAAEMENASRRTIADNNNNNNNNNNAQTKTSLLSFRQSNEHQQPQYHSGSTSNNNINNSDDYYYYQDNHENDDDPHVMEFANYLFALQAEMESEIAKDKVATTETTINDNKFISSDAQSTMTIISTDTMHPQKHHKDKEEEENDTTSIPITADDSRMGDEFLKMLSNEVRYKQLINQSPYSLADVEYSVLLQRFLDNIEDGLQKKNGKFAGMSKLKRMSMPRENRKTVVVVSVVCNDERSEGHIISVAY